MLCRQCGVSMDKKLLQGPADCESLNPLKSTHQSQICENYYIHENSRQDISKVIIREISKSHYIL